MCVGFVNHIVMKQVWTIHGLFPRTTLEALHPNYATIIQAVTTRIRNEDPGSIPIATTISKRLFRANLPTRLNGKGASYKQHLAIS